jgi:glycosyltransferase involved in cell wall biosynthesis
VKKPNLLFVTTASSHIDEQMRIGHIEPFPKLFSRDFNVLKIDFDCDLDEHCEHFKPDLIVFSAGVESPKNVRAPLIKNLNLNRSIPRVGLLLNDLYGMGRVSDYDFLLACGCEAFFSLGNYAANGIEELSERSYMIPFWLDEEIFRDYDHEKIVPLGMYGAGFNDFRQHYPWRKEIARKLIGQFPIFSINRPDEYNRVGYTGRSYAEWLNRTKIVFACGTIVQAFTRKPMEICGSRSALFCQQTPIMESLGFRDEENCVFVDASNVADKVEYYLNNENELQQLTDRGYAFVREQHSMDARRQIKEWFDLRQQHSGQFIKIVQRGLLEPLTLSDEEKCWLLWDKRNPMEQIVDLAYNKLFAGNLSDALRLFQSITRNLFVGHVESRTGEILCLLLKGRLKEVLVMLKHIKKLLVERFGCYRNEPILEGLLVLSLILESGKSDANLDEFKYDELGHSLLSIVRLIFNGQAISAKSVEIENSGKGALVGVQYRLNLDAKKWISLVEEMFVNNGRGSLWETLSGGYNTPKPIANLEELKSAITKENDAGMCLQLAQRASALGDQTVAYECYEKAVSLDRSCGPAYLEMGKRLGQAAQYADAYLCLKEAERAGQLDGTSQQLLQALAANPDLQTDSVLQYQQRRQVFDGQLASRPRRILIFTNLLPPQEMGGYGRSIWELCEGLLLRGHTVSILTADVPELQQKAYAGYERVERHVQRNLQLFGGWSQGGAQAIDDVAQIKQIARHNVKVVLHQVSTFQPDVCMVGNLDFLGAGMLDPILKHGVPVLHRLGNGMPGYSAEMTPQSPLYCIAGCSEWVNGELETNGFKAHNFALLPPGSPLHEYYRFVPPNYDQLRICFAGLMMAYKGPHLILEALDYLKKLKIPFSCEFAGDFKDPAFEQQFKQRVRQYQLENSIRLLGFCDREQLRAMFDRSNVLVMPSVFEEPFGKVQIEAQAAGLAVVRSPVGGYKDMIEDGVNGLLFNSEDAKDLARQLFVLRGDPGLWSRIAIQGQHDAFRFKTQASVETLEALFEGLIAKRMTPDLQGI